MICHLGIAHVYAADVESMIYINHAEAETTEHDPDNANEPKYCYCDRGSYGEMVVCDNEACPLEWFHLGCTDLQKQPEQNQKWFCQHCAPLFDTTTKLEQGAIQILP